MKEAETPQSWDKKIYIYSATRMIEWAWVRIVTHICFFLFFCLCCSLIKIMPHWHPNHWPIKHRHKRFITPATKISRKTKNKKKHFKEKTNRITTNRLSIAEVASVKISIHTFWRKWFHTVWGNLLWMYIECIHVYRKRRFWFREKKVICESVEERILLRYKRVSVSNAVCLMNFFLHKMAHNQLVLNTNGMSGFDHWFFLSKFFSFKFHENTNPINRESNEGVIRTNEDKKKMRKNIDRKESIVHAYVYNFIKFQSNVIPIIRCVVIRARKTKYKVESVIWKFKYSKILLLKIATHTHKNRSILILMMMHPTY